MFLWLIGVTGLDADIDGIFSAWGVVGLEDWEHSSTG